MTHRLKLTSFVWTWLGLIFATQIVHAEIRTWTDRTGKFKIEAEFVEVKDGVAVLKRADQNRIEVPLDRLSDQDQTFVKSQLEPADPFKVVPSPAATPLKPGEVAEPSWEGATEVPVGAGDRWEVKVGEAPPMGFPPKAAALPKKTDFFEGLSGLAVSAAAKRGVLSYHLKGRGRDGQSTSRIVVIDLATARTLANAPLDGEFSVLAVHPDGKRIVAQRKQTVGRDAKQTLVTLTALGNKATVVDEWIPYSQADERSRNVRFAEFTPDGKFITANEPGTVVVWDFDTRQIDFYFNIPRTSIPALSPDGKLIGYSGGDKVGLVDLTTREPIALKSAPQMNFWVKAQFSPSGKRLAASSQQKLMIWDVETGDVLFQGEIPGVALAFGLHFPAEEFVLLSNEYLVEWSSGIKVWQYTGGSHPVCERGVVFYGGDALVPIAMPQPEATRLLDQAKKQSDLFVVKKGTALKLDVSGVPAQYQDEVQKSLTRQIEAIGCKVAATADVTVKATVTGPVKDSVSYFSAGSFEIDRYASTITFEYGGKTLWQGSQSNVPGFLSSPREKSYQQQIDEASAKPNLYYFGHVHLPEFLQKPSESSGPGRAQQTLGVSKVGVK